MFIHGYIRGIIAYYNLHKLMVGCWFPQFFLINGQAINALQLLLGGSMRLNGGAWVCHRRPGAGTIGERIRGIIPKLPNMSG
jgi:hypothetical protein